MRVSEAKRYAKSSDPAVQREASRVLAAREARKRRTAPKRKASREAKAAKRTAHRTSTATLRAQAFERSGGRCEVSGVELGAAWELHHLVSAGLRRSRQSLDNVLAVSWEVHRRIHRGDLDALLDVKESCIRLGLKDGLRAIEHRIGKCAESRAVQRAHDDVSPKTRAAAESFLDAMAARPR